MTPYLAMLDAEPVGYVQSYVAADMGNGWWTDVCDRGVLGTDQFIADGRRLGQGLGTGMVRRFASFLFEDPGVSRIQVDPAVENRRAIRCYQRAGFTPMGPVTTPDGESLLMTLPRP